MPRVATVYKPSDHPNASEPAVREALDALFGRMFPGVEAPEIDRMHGGFAVVARDPSLAMHLLRLSDYIVREMPWSSRRKGLRELAVQALNYHYKCEYSFRAHLAPAAANGLNAEQLAAIPYWETSPLFDEVQRLVIEFTLATVGGKVPEALFARAVAAFGETETIEFTTAVAWWAFWAMILNATQPEIRP